MKIIFMGNSAIACPILNALNNSKHDLLAVVSNPPKQFGRGRSLSYTPVGQLAKELKLNFFPAESLNNEVLQDSISILEADLFIVVAFRILPKSFLSLSKKGAINLHGSLLPKYRGAAPIQHALLNGDELTGISTFLIDNNLRLSFDVTTVLTIDKSILNFLPISIKALVSFGKHDPPYAGPALKNLSPIR